MSTAAYILHFKEVPNGLPTAVYIKPATWIRIICSGAPFNYDFGFRHFGYIEGTEAWLGLSDSLRAAVGWDEVAGQVGIYTGYVETGFDNVMWREELTIIVTESDGTMDVNDYTPFGTIQQLPRNLQVIESQAFAGTQMTEVDIPAGVTSIGQYAFDGSGLIGVYTHNNPVAINWAVSNGYVAVTE